MGTVALGVTGIGLASASAYSGAAAVTPQQTVTGSLITRPPGTLRPGHKVRASTLGQRHFTSATHGFALAFASTAQYPAATTDGGKTWRTNGPALHINAAQAPLAVTIIGAANVKTVHATAAGRRMDTTSDRGMALVPRAFQRSCDGEHPGLERPSGGLHRRLSRVRTAG